MPIITEKKSLVDPLKIKLIMMTSTYCEEHLDAEYRDLCKKLIKKMARKKIVLFLSGKLEIWAASVIYAIGKINFLSDKNFKPYASQEDIATYFKVSPSIVGQKAKIIREMFFNFLTNKNITDDFSQTLLIRKIFRN